MRPERERRVQPYTFSCQQVLMIFSTAAVPSFRDNQGATGTGCIEGFFRAENCNKNLMKSINTISLFFILKSVIKFNLFLLCQS